MSKANTIMVLYTGGTIGMQASANGLAPASGFEARMREQLAHLPAPAWRFREMSPLIDSANMTPAYWQHLRSAVVEAVDEGCGGVLILHGTDTLAYSAAAMSFQLLGLPSPVVFTGSMLPAGVPDSDAWENVRGALAGAGRGPGAGRAPVLPRRADGADPLRENPQLRPSSLSPRCSVNGGAAKAEALARRPGLPPAQGAGERRRAAAGAGSLIGGAAGQPWSPAASRRWCWNALAAAPGPATTRRSSPACSARWIKDVVVVAITQCHEGGVELDVYEAGSRLRGVGVLSGGGMTREAAFGKLQRPARGRGCPTAAGPASGRTGPVR
jgi:L-asparaginase